MTKQRSRTKKGGPQGRPSSTSSSSPTTIFITWDDWGGWLDHVDPPEVERWTDGTQFCYGSRVGCLVLGPLARSGHVSRALHSHVSLVKFCEVNLVLQPLNSRDRAADGMENCFDLTGSPAPPPKT